MNFRELIKKLSFFCKIEDKNRLFYVAPQIRERATIWRILRDPVFFTILCNDTWKWFAAEIPYQIDGKNAEIDILMCRPKNLEYGSPLIFKGYQVKVSLINRNDKEKSLKRSDGSRFRKAIGQLERLKSFGCDRVCFLEVIIFEQTRKSSSLPQIVIDEIKKKKQILSEKDVGYVVLPIQFRPDISEDWGGYWHPPINILLSPEQQRGKKFLELADRINSFFDSQNENNGDRKSVV